MRRAARTTAASARRPPPLVDGPAAESLRLDVRVGGAFGFRFAEIHRCFTLPLERDVAGRRGCLAAERNSTTRARGRQFQRGAEMLRVLIGLQVRTFQRRLTGAMLCPGAVTKEALDTPHAAPAERRSDELFRANCVGPDANGGATFPAQPSLGQ